MHVERLAILSHEGLDNSDPWFELDWDGEGVCVTKGNCHHHDRASSTRVPINFGLTSSHPNSHVDWIYGVTLEGEYFFKAGDDTDFWDSLSEPNVIEAHLGFYRPATDTLRLLEFCQCEIPDNEI
jgi:hypothetical protein